MAARARAALVAAAVAGAFALAPGAIATPTGDSAPYDTSDAWWTCWPDGPDCDTTADADSETGLLHARAAVAASAGSASTSHAVASVVGHVELAEPASAVDAMFRVRLPASSATASGDGASSLTVIVTASQNACGGGCMAGAEKRVAGTDGDVEPDGASLTVPVRVTRWEGGNVPAGRLTVKVELYAEARAGTAYQGAAGTGRAEGTAEVLGVDVETRPPLVATHVTAEATYAGGGLYRGQTTPNPCGAVNVAAACFAVPARASHVAIEVVDSEGAPVGGVLRPTMQPRGFDREVCGTGGSELAPGEGQIAVFIENPALPGCGTAINSASGRVRAVFTVCELDE